MSRFIDEADRSQGTLLPETIDEYVAEENPVRVIEAFVAALDLASLGFEGVEPKATGRPAYHPATMLKIYLYGYLNRIQSTRRLEHEARRNLELMWLVGRLAPDFKTLADFRAGNTAAIKNVCREFIVLCRRWHLFTEATVAIDGSKFKAVNHRDRNFTQRQDEDADGADRAEHRRVPGAARSDGSQGDAEHTAQDGTAQGADRDAEGRDEPARRAEGPDGGLAGRPGVADRPRCPLDGEPGQGHRHRRLQRADRGRCAASPDRRARSDERRLGPAPAEADVRSGPRSTRHE